MRPNTCDKGRTRSRIHGKNEAARTALATLILNCAVFLNKEDSLSYALRAVETLNKRECWQTDEQSSARATSHLNAAESQPVLPPEIFLEPDEHTRAQGQRERVQLRVEGILGA